MLSECSLGLLDLLTWSDRSCHLFSLLLECIFFFFSGLIHTESSNMSQFLVKLLCYKCYHLIKRRIKIVKRNLIKYYAKFDFVVKLPCDNMEK